MRKRKTKLNDQLLNTLTPQDLDKFVTEQRNEYSSDIDSKTALEIVSIINNEDKKVAFAVERTLPQIAALVDEIVAAFKIGGRLFYIGAGTSGRLGVLDASECPPTFSAEPQMVQGLIAGGNIALTTAVENAEDRFQEGIDELKQRGFCKDDVLVGITASGQAPYVLGALEYAQSIGAVTGAISCNKESKTFEFAKYKLFADVGPEVITGSTRMKSGTAQKLILNMLTTASMIRIGKVYKNLMVDLRPVNHKLVLRSIRLIQAVTSCTEQEARDALEASGKQLKAAIVMILVKVGREEAIELLKRADGHIAKIINAV